MNRTSVLETVFSSMELHSSTINSISLSRQYDSNKVLCGANKDKLVSIKCTLFGFSKRAAAAAPP